MKHAHDIEITLRGQCVTFEFQADPPDETVGLFGNIIVEHRILAEDGAVLDWELTDAELQAIQTQVDEYMDSWRYDED